ncbi:MAG TPA: hypothetical protein VG733_17885 [Chthoniobacteraceae bacterium]|nr:hypothetical protein [Bryobacteraceae bacterium]HWB61358.1 hypothetical protein [Chthoniobacteraceae bacterium]
MAASFRIFHGLTGNAVKGAHAREAVHAGIMPHARGGLGAGLLILKGIRVKMAVIGISGMTIGDENLVAIPQARRKRCARIAVSHYGFPVFRCVRPVGTEDVQALDDDAGGLNDSAGAGPSRSQRTDEPGRTR